jgi:oligopeptide transport system permease protein
VTLVAAPPVVLGLEDLPEQMSYWQDVRKRFFRNRVAVLGLVILSILLLMAILGPFIYPNNYTSARNLPDLPRRMGSEYGIFGTDLLGRNLWHLSAFGGRSVVSINVAGDAVRGFGRVPRWARRQCHQSIY